MKSDNQPKVLTVSQPVRIVIQNRIAVVPGDVADTVCEVLSPRSHSSRQARNEILSFDRDKRGRLRLDAGLLPRIQDHLERLGHRVHVVDRRWPVSMFESKSSRSPSTEFLRDIQNIAGESLARRMGGRVAIQRPGDVPDVIAALACLHPNTSTLVVTRNRHQAQRLASQLCPLIHLPITSNTNYHWKNGPQLHVDNMHSVVGRSVEDWPIVIVADHKAAVAKMVIDQVRCMDSHVFAILPTTRKFDKEDLLRLEVLSGPEIYREQDDAALLTSVEVAWLRAVSYPAAQSLNPLQRKQFYFWRNHRRNQSIADAAHSIRTLDMPELRRLGLDRTAIVRHAVPVGKKPRVAVLVETPEHARTLNKLLPKWNRVQDCGSDSSSFDLPLSLDKAIVTIPRAYKQGLAVDVIIRAAGTEHSWKGAYGPHSAMNDSQMLVVDIRDDVDAQASKDWKRRQHDYEQRNWVAGITNHWITKE